MKRLQVRAQLASLNPRRFRAHPGRADAACASGRSSHARRAGRHPGANRCRAKAERCLLPRARARASTDRTWRGAGRSTMRLTSPKGSPLTEAPPMGAPERVPPSLSLPPCTPPATELPPPPSGRCHSCPAPWRSSIRPKASACAHRVQFFQRGFFRFSRGAPSLLERSRASFWPNERPPRKQQPELDRRF